MKIRLLSMLLAALMLVGTLAVSIPVSAKLNFNDTDGHWGEAAIEFVVDAGLMNGVGDGTSFAPNMNLTRGMVVTVLYRDNGSPKQNFKGTFLDVAEGQYYTAASEWAYANGIVNGTGTDDRDVPYFSPDRDITRQELATMFKRYADFKYVDTTVGAADIASFPDSASVADWATDAVKWAVGTGLITGKGGGGAATLSPTDKAMRAEFATIIKRFKEADFEYRLAYNAPVVQSTFTEIPYAKVENADVYVSVDGSDTNPGTIDKPLATFEAAKLKVRELKATAKDEIVVAFKAGDYGIIDNVQFADVDSGTENVPVVYCAYGDGEVYFTNGLYIDESEFKPIEDSDKVFFKEENFSSIMKVDLADRPLADQITSFSPLSNETGFCWVARTPNKENGIDQYFAGRTKHVPHPDSEYKTLNEILKAIFLDYDKYFPNGNSDVAKNLDQNKLQTSGPVAEKLASYRTLEGVQLIGYIGKVWHSDTLEITGFDKETNIVSTTSPYYEYYAMVQSQQQAYINNVSEELDDVGEYWIDPATKTLYVYQPQGSYTIGMADTFITLHSGTSNISFTRLNFRTCNGVGIYANGDNFKMDQCSIMYVGGSYALHSNGALNIEITNSTFAYCHESGVYVRGPQPGKRKGYDYYTLNNTGFVFENNLIHDVDMASVPVESGGLLFGYQIGGRIAHNEIYNSARYGIDFKYGNIDCVMEYNYLHHCMQNSADGGALYCGRVAIHRGNIVRYNIIADIYALNPIHTGGTFAIYMDDGHENLICYANVFYNSGAIMNNGGRDHEIYDNVFIKSGSGIVGKSNIVDISDYNFDVWTEGWNDIRNIPDENTEAGKIWKERWPELYDILAICNDPSCYKDTDLYNKPIAYCHNNYCFDGASHNFRDEWVENGDLENNVDIPEGENPLFVNPTFGDYTIKDGAGIMDNHFAEIGRY